MENSHIVQSVVDRFRNEWNRGEIPSLAHFLSNVSDDNPQTRRLLLLELIAVDLENKWRRRYSETETESGFHDTAIGQSQTGTGQLPSHPPLLEEYVSEWSELGGVDKIPTSLIVHEYRLRHMYGDHPDHAQYETRFASHGQTLAVSLSQIDDELLDAKSLSTEKAPTLPGSREEMTLLPDSPGMINQSLGSDSDSRQPPSSYDREETLPMTGGYKSKSSPGHKRFGNYELLGEIARGAMGVVYKARQLNPKRIVAVKMILTGQLAGEEEIRRFHAEAENAGCLKHANIVTIYESGELEGQHYFSMDYIEGQSLADLIQEKPLKMEEAARFSRIIAEAIQYAHTQGVLHRDMKPSNVLIDADGQPHVTDFGIAKQVQNESHMTADGAAMGTPSYMPPEQARGDLEALGPTCDVYSLGALLYHLVTGRPPFLARSPMETMMQVLHNEPASPRVLNPEVDRDLETICLKCLEKEPHRRYATAQDLADDLARYQRHEPIVARPISSTARFRKWCRRNPGVAFFSATTFLSLVAISVGATYRFVEAEKQKKEVENLNSSLEVNIQAKENALIKVKDLNLSLETTIQEKQTALIAEENARKEADRQKKIANENERDAVEARKKAVVAQEKAEESEAVAIKARVDEGKAKDKAQANLGKANQAVQEMLTEVAQEELDYIPYMTEVREKLLEKAITFYENLLKDNDPNDVSLQENIATSKYLIGTIQQKIEKYEEAESAFLGSIEDAARFGTLSEKPPGLPQFLLIELKSHRALGDLYTFHINKTDKTDDGKEFDRAQTEIMTAREIGRTLTELDDNHADYFFELARTLTTWGIYLGETNDPQAAIKEIENSVRLHKHVVMDFDDHPNHDQHLRRLASSLSNLGRLYFKNRNLQKAIEQYNQAIAIQSELIKKYPKNSVYKLDLAGTNTNRAMSLTEKAYSEEGDLRKSTLEKAAFACRGSITEFKKLVDDYPSIPHYRFQFSKAKIELGRVLIEELRLYVSEKSVEVEVKFSEAKQTLEAAEQELDALRREDQIDHSYQRSHVHTFANLGHLYAVMNSPKYYKTAEQHFQRALQMQKKVIAASEDPNPEDEYLLARFSMDLAFVLIYDKRPVESRKALQEAKRIVDRLDKVSSDGPIYFKSLKQDTSFEELKKYLDQLQESDK